MSRQWAPGSVAMVTTPTITTPRMGMRIEAAGHAGWQVGAIFADDAVTTSTTPIYCVDPTSSQQMRLIRDTVKSAMDAVAPDSQDPARDTLRNLSRAFRELAAPPRPDVFAHIVVDKDDEQKIGLCGKTWVPDPDVNIVGKCPDCLVLVNDENWTG